MKFILGSAPKPRTRESQRLGLEIFLKLLALWKPTSLQMGCESETAAHSAETSHRSWEVKNQALHSGSLWAPSPEALCGVSIDICLVSFILGGALKVAKPVADIVSTGIAGEGSHTVSLGGDPAWHTCPAVPVHPPRSTQGQVEWWLDLIRVWIYLL